MLQFFDADNDIVQRDFQFFETRLSGVSSKIVNFSVNLLGLVVSYANADSYHS